MEGNTQNEGYDLTYSGGKSRESHLRREIERWFEREKDNMLRDLGRLIAVRSVREEPLPGKPFGEGPAAALREAEEILREMGFAPVNFENLVVTADLNGREPVLGILCHLDVVPEGSGWSTDPFKATIKDGKIYGRGAADDKGPAIAAMYALKAAREIAPELTRGCRIILGSAEETGHEDLTEYRKAHAMPPNLFTPDADYPVVNLEKGRLSPLFEAKWEKSEALPRLAFLTGGETANRVPDQARAEVLGVSMEDVEPLCRRFTEETGARLTAEPMEGGVRVFAAGVGAHAAEPEKGVNAQTALLALLRNLNLADCGSTRAVTALCRLFPHGDTAGRALGIAVEDELSGALTLNFGVLKIDERGLSGGCDLRLPLASTEENTDRALKNALEDAGFTVTGMEKSLVHHTPADTPFVQTLLRVYEAYTGEKGQCQSVGGQTYVHGIPGGVAFGCAFPGTDNRMHAADEFAVIDELILSARMFTQVILEMCR